MLLKKPGRLKDNGKRRCLIPPSMAGKSMISVFKPNLVICMEEFDDLYMTKDAYKYVLLHGMHRPD